MKKSILSLLILTTMGSSVVFAASPNVKGGSSNTAGVQVGKSNHIMFSGNNSGVSLNGAASYIDLAAGPIQGSNTAISARGNGGILKATDMGLPLPINVAQVWKASATHNTANFEINSIRQITTLAFAPQFGGLVIGQVADATGTPLPVGSGVYFGEWAPRAAGTPPADSTDLNMSSASHTVWYVGDNAVTTSTMPTSINATYAVVGINGVGTVAGGTPDNPNLYTGDLAVSYAGGAGSISNSINRGTDSINFAGTDIYNDGSFNNGANIEGHFYNGANALAGIYTGGAAQDHVAFGGSKVSGTITP